MNKPATQNTDRLPRGVRNHNPGNLDRTSDRWQGMAADQSGDPRFVVFISPEFGLRALAKTLLTYQDKHGLRTVRGIINRWAPPVENNTDAYIRSVSDAIGVEPDDVINLRRVCVMLELVRAIVRHENGVQPYADATILAGLRLAGVQ